MEAKIRLRQLHQTGIIHDYVKDFTTLTLEIHDLSDDDAFVYFFDILKGWAKIELNRWEVKYLATTITEAKDLVDFSQREPSKSRDPRKLNFERDGERSMSTRNEAPRANAPKTDNVQRTPFNSGRDARPPNWVNGCFLCDGPHAL